MLLSVLLKAQITFTDSLKARYDSLQPHVATGLLADRSPLSPFIVSANSNPLRLNGINDTTLDEVMWRSLHRYLYHMAYHSNDLNFSPETYDSLFDVELYGQSRVGMNITQLLNLQPRSDIVLGLIDREFNMITPEAWDSAYIKTDTLTFSYRLNTGPFQLNDTISYYNHPDSVIVVDSIYHRDTTNMVARTFSTHRSIALGALHYQAYATGNSPSVSISIPTIFRMQLQGSVYEVDFDDGQGFRPWPTSTSVTISYPVYGQKTITIRTPNTGPGSDSIPYLKSKTFITVSELKHGYPDARIELPNQFVNSCLLDYNDYGIGKGVGFVKYRYNAGPNPKLHKPVIIVEGLETAKTISKTRDKGDEHGFGALNWLAFSSGDFGEIAPQLSKFPDIMDSLRATGHDIILLDLLTNRATIQQNGNAFINLVQYANNQLQTYQSKEEIIVIGASMGGLVSRWGVRKMEMEGCCHNIRLFGTFSTPHQGANIPLGLQEFLYSLGHGQNLLGKGDGAKKLYDEALNSPVARQMLVYHKDPTAAADRAAFVRHMDSMGFPQNCRLLALTNGSGTASGQQQHNEIMSGRFLSGGDALVTVKEKIWAPLAFPDLVTPVLGVIDIANGTTSSTRPWTLLYAEAYAIKHSNTPSSQLILERGDDAKGNVNRLTWQYGVYATGLAASFLSLLIHVLAYAIATLGFCVACPAVTASSINSQIAIATIFTTILSLKSIHNEHLNYQDPTHYEYVNKYPTLAYDQAPGDYNNTQYRIHKTSDGVVDYHDFGHHNFISTVSALAIDTNDLFLNVKDNRPFLVQSKKTPFEFIFYNERGAEDASVNERHVEITKWNLSWLMNVIRITENPLQGVLNGQPQVLNKYYNYGDPLDTLAPARILKDLVITNGGLLHVNHSGKVGYLTSPYGTTAAGSIFQVKTYNPACGGTHVRIESGGQMILGSTGQNPNRGEAIFLENGILEIEDGGTLTINDGSRVVMEAGSQLILHPGAVINLPGENAILEIAGKVVLKSDASLQYQGNGFIRLAQGVGDLSQIGLYWQLDGNNTFLLSETDTTSKVLEVVQEAYIPNGLDSLSIVNGRVELAGGKKLHIHSPFRSDNVCYTNIDNSGNDGVWIYGQANTTIRNSYFMRGARGLNALLTYYGNDLELVNCKFFDHTHFGLYTEGQSVNIDNCRFDGGNHGWFGRNMTGECHFKNSWAKNAAYGVEFIGQAGVHLYLETATFENNTLGIRVDNTSLHSQCGRFLNNATSGLEGERSYLYLNEDSKNKFNGNDIAIKVVDGLDLHLTEGKNDFSNNTSYYLYGAFQANHLLGNPPTLDAHNNVLPGNANALPISLTVDPGNTNVTLSNWNNFNLQPNWSCFVTMTPLNAIVLEYPSFKVINTTNYTNTYFSDAVYQAVGLVSYEDQINDDLTAISRLNEILAFNLPNPTEDELFLSEYAFQMMMKALGNAFTQELIPLNRAVEGTTEDPYLDIVIDEIDDRLANIDPSAATAYEEEFQLNLAKSHMYRMAEHYDYALNVLQAAGAWASGADLFESQYWECVCQAEESLLQEEITIEAYIDQKAICQAQLDAKRGRDPVVYGLTSSAIRSPENGSKLIQKVYPNPTSNMAYIELLENPGSLAYEVNDVMGKVVLSGIVDKSVNGFRIDLQELPSGTYSVKLLNKRKVTEVIKLVKS